ncbi:MAG: hypothetical protein KA436_10265 [Oligoflexales bacterium]|nr:hypothetical protein [Oligoflexales bacterium]
MSKKIIIAESSPAVQKAIKLALSSFDLVFETVQKVDELKSKLNPSVDLVMIDLRVEGTGSGQNPQDLTFLQNQEVPVLWLLGSAQTPPFSGERMGTSLKARQSILHKPFSSQELIDKISKQISLKVPVEANDKGKNLVKNLVGFQESSLLRDNKDELLARALAEVKAEAGELVTSFIKEYCDKHFRPMAKEVLVEELRRLADEKSKITQEF